MLMVASNLFVGATGTLQLINSSGESESVDYSAVSNEGTNYTFVVSTTLIHSYAVGDNANIAESPLGRATNVDVTDKDTGRFLINISANSARYLNDIDGLAAINNTRFELQVRDDNANLIYVSVFDFLALNIYDFTGAIPPPEDGSYYTKTEVNALLETYLKKDFGLLPIKTTLSNDDGFVINNSDSNGDIAEVSWKTIKDNIDASDSVSGSFVYSDLVDGVLSIPHAFGVWRPAAVTIWDNNNQQTIAPDEVNISDDLIEIDLSSFGSIPGTWYYSIGSGGASGGSALDQYFTYSPIRDAVICSKSMEIPPSDFYIGEGTVINSGG